LESRLITFAAAILSVSARLLKTPQARHISNQILRSGTAAAANYGEARGAESRSDFIHKMGIVLKELNETLIWLEVIAKAQLLPNAEIVAVISENRSFVASLRPPSSPARAATSTWRAKRKSRLSRFSKCTCRMSDER
jgi:four helix bundle protein